MPDSLAKSMDFVGKGGSYELPLRDEPAAHQLVGEVMAHQGNDG